MCPNAPFNDPVNPLVSMVNMKMFVFNNMKDGDELTMSVTMFGCVHYEDCLIVSYIFGIYKQYLPPN